ncbi:MAG: NAD-dependent epimerase/dehydratase family protein [Pararhodobacter sp.]
MKPLLITGANGRVGQLLRSPLGNSVIWSRRGPGADLDWDPLAGPEPLIDHCTQHGAPAALLQLARGLAGDPLRDDAAIGRATLAATQAAGIPRVLFASTSAVYGLSRPEPWEESDPVAPQSPYARSKLAMEQACAAPGVTMLRIGNVAGADALLTNPARPLLLDHFADGTGPVRTYIGPQTLARVLLALAQAPALPSVLNIATPKPLDMADLAAAAGLPVKRQPAPPGALARLTLATARLETLYAFGDTDSDPATMVAEWRACKDPE